MLCRLGLGLICLSGLAAAEGEPPAAEPVSTTDPSLHIEARGEQIYRSRDLDALLLVTRRQLGRPLREDEEHTLRRLLAQILVTREALLPLLAELPQDLDGPARDQLVLDLLAYQPQPAPADEAVAPGPGDPAAPTQDRESVASDDGPLPPPTEGQARPEPEPAADPATVTDPPLAEDLIPLAPLQLSRRSNDGSTHRLDIGLALRLGASDDREELLARLPLLQDAFITTLHGLGEDAITSPDPSGLKRALSTAARTAAPGFTGEVLITSLMDPALQPD